MRRAVAVAALVASVLIIASILGGFVRIERHAARHAAFMVPLLAAGAAAAVLATSRGRS